MQTELKNKIAIVTGSYGDIGRAICQKLASNGIKIALLGRDLKKLKSQKSKLLEKNKTEIIISNLDVTDFNSYKDAVDSIISKWEKIDILINNAGITKDNLIIRMSNEEWEDVINTNLKGTFIGCKLVSKFMIKQKFGKIINISSVVGKIGNKGQANYVASKAGMDGITKTLSKELGSRGINVNSIAPGYIETNMTSSLSEKIKNDYLIKLHLIDLVSLKK